jgi:hypothetical protein
MWARMIARIDERIAKVEPVATQPLGSVEQRLALIELASLRHRRDQCENRLQRAIEGLKPTK